MVNSIDFYIKDITRQMKAHKLYNKGLDMQIKSLASAMRNLDMANAQIDGLTETTVLEETRYGSKLAPHPVFKVAKEAQELITRQMKALGLTAEAMSGEVEDDPVVEVTKKLTNKRAKPTILKKED